MKDMHYKRIKVMVKRRSYINHSLTFSLNMLVFIRHFNYFIYQILLIIISNSNDKQRENETRKEAKSRDKKLNTSIASHCSRQCIQKQLNAGQKMLYQILKCCVQITYVLQKKYLLTFSILLNLNFLNRYEIPFLFLYKILKLLRW